MLNLPIGPARGRRLRHFRAPLRPLLPFALALLLAALPLPLALAALNPERREAAFVGYSEQQRGSEAALGDAAASSRSEPCPADERPDECPGWAAEGECLSNPLYMRTACKTSCRVAAGCTRILAGSAAADAPWPGHATAAGTTAWAAESKSASLDLFRMYAVHYSGATSTFAPPFSGPCADMGLQACARLRSVITATPGGLHARLPPLSRRRQPSGQPHPEQPGRWHLPGRQ